MARVLVVDDDPWTQRMVSAVLSQSGHMVDLASDGWEALCDCSWIQELCQAMVEVLVTQLPNQRLKLAARVD